MTKKRITKGPCKGLREISERTLREQVQEMIETLAIPVKKRLMPGRRKKEKLTPSYCRNGDIERCPAPCGACLVNPKAGSLTASRWKYIDVLDTDAYMAQNPVIMVSN